MASKRDQNAPERRVSARFARGRRGSVAAEYVMILAVVGMMIAVGAMGLSNAIADAFYKSKKCMEDAMDGPGGGRENPCSNAPPKEGS